MTAIRSWWKQPLQPSRRLLRPSLPLLSRQKMCRSQLRQSLPLLSRQKMCRSQLRQSCGRKLALRVF
ncbi:hypothetical protein DPMN_127904 [Dreissena polymorpha]|uniref:Uncharacterized protein n=1 Tax=Dreissena polymorpha TaxID=45954 RepID=A0A9D4GZT0_DREPO|nr:hypothetical protein DPMN_127904 [Dreissena polymorpha]